jgi:enoyl-[acyl-carrier protein] reductase II
VLFALSIISNVK